MKHVLALIWIPICSVLDSAVAGAVSQRRYSSSNLTPVTHLDQNDGANLRRFLFSFFLQSHTRHIMVDLPFLLCLRQRTMRLVPRRIAYGQ